MMSASSDAARRWCPPALAGAAVRALQVAGLRPGPDFRGRFADWDEAVRASRGYDAPVILDRVEAAVRRVLEGSAAAERDSVTFDVAPWPWPLLSALARAQTRANAQESAPLRVLDFGGSLGGTALMVRRFFGERFIGSWRVVEQPHFVSRAATLPMHASISFHESIESAISGFRPHVVVASGVLQYLPKPYGVLDALSATDPAMIVVDRTPSIAEGADVLTVQHVPPHIFPASYPSWLFADDAIPRALASRFTVEAAFLSDERLTFEGASVPHRGWIFEARAR